METHLDRMLYFELLTLTLWPIYIGEKEDNICQSMWDKSGVLWRTWWGTQWEPIGTQWEHIGNIKRTHWEHIVNQGKWQKILLWEFHLALPTSLVGIVSAPSSNIWELFKALISVGRTNVLNSCLSCNLYSQVHSRLTANFAIQKKLMMDGPQQVAP
jgi:hypothetical protein